MAVGRPLNCIWTRWWSLELLMVVDEWLASSMARCGEAEYERPLPVATGTEPIIPHCPLGGYPLEYHPIEYGSHPLC